MNKENKEKKCLLTIDGLRFWLNNFEVERARARLETGNKTPLEIQGSFISPDAITAITSREKVNELNERTGVKIWHCKCGRDVPRHVICGNCGSDN